MQPTKKNTLKGRGMLPVAAALMLLGVASARADYPSLILSNNPVAYYRLEETSGGTAADSSPHGLDAQYIFNSTLAFPALGLQGIDTHSVGFNGGADFGFIDVPYNPLLAPTTNGTNAAPFSAECWANPNAHPGNGNFEVPFGMIGTFGTGIYLNGAGWNFYQEGTGANSSLWVLDMRPVVFSSAPVPINPGTWYHLAVTFDGVNATFYVNGAAQFTTGASGFLPDVASDGQIGAGQNSGQLAFSGDIDEVAFYTNALSAADILAHYQVGTNSFAATFLPPSIVQDPSSTTNFSGTTASFSVVATGTQPLSYQWFRGTNAISGATNNLYSFVATFPADNGATFHVVVSNFVNTTTSGTATLTVLTNLNIIGPPFSITRNVGSYAAFRVAAGGALPITYQWSKSTDGINFSPISGATGDTLWLTNVQLTDSGSSYSVLVSNPFTSTTPFPATLTVQPRAHIVPITGYARVVMADKPVAYWRLDETNGTTAFDAAGTFDGTYDNSQGIVTLGVTNIGIPHETDFAIDLAATNHNAGGVVSVPYALELNSFGPWSAEAWIRADSLDGNDFRTVFSSMYNPNSSVTVFGWNVYQHVASAWTLNIFQGTGSSTFLSDFADIPIVAGSWYHMVITDDGVNINLFVNDALVNSTTVAATGFIPQGLNGDATLAGAPEVLGQRSDFAFDGFDGGIDDVAFYNYALTPQQIQLHFLNTTRLTITPIPGNKVVVSWPVGTLQSSANVATGYADVVGATSPFTNTVSGAQLYYRVKVQ